MKINGKKIANFFASFLKRDISYFKKKGQILQLATIFVGYDQKQRSFIKRKSEMAKKLGINFKLIHFKKIPSFELFLQMVKKTGEDQKTHGIIIQQPLPTRLATESIYDYIPPHKEIEGHRKKSPFFPPIGLAVLTVIKYIFGSQKLNEDLLLNYNLDSHFFKKILSNKKIVLVGRGLTGGKPIGKTLSQLKINYLNIHSKTPNPESYYKEADIIITAVGKKVITPQVLKKGVVLINVGLRWEGKKPKGDYDEEEIKNIASFYTPTPGGIGPLDIIYLYKNLIDAFKLQNNLLT